MKAFQILIATFLFGSAVAGVHELRQPSEDLGVVADMHKRDDMSYSIPLDFDQVNCSYSANIVVGTGSNKRQFKVLIDTGSDILWLFAANGSTNPYTNHKGFDNRTAEHIAPNGGLVFRTISYGTVNITGDVVQDTVQIGDLVVPETLILHATNFTGGLTQDDFGYDGILGLGPRPGAFVPSLVVNAWQQNLIKPAFSIYASRSNDPNDQSTLFMSNISLGLAPEHRSTKLTTLSWTKPTGNDIGFWNAQLYDVKYADKNISPPLGQQGDESTSTKAGYSQSFTIDFDTGTPGLALPSTTANMINSKIGVFNSTTNDLLCSGAGQAPDLEFIFEGNFTLPLTARDYISQWWDPTENKLRCISLIQPVDVSEGGGTCGEPCFRAWYTVFNMEDNTVSLALSKQ